MQSWHVDRISPQTHLDPGHISFAGAMAIADDMGEGQRHADHIYGGVLLLIPP